MIVVQYIKRQYFLSNSYAWMECRKKIKVNTVIDLGLDCRDRLIIIQWINFNGIRSISASDQLKLEPKSFRFDNSYSGVLKLDIQLGN